MKRKLFAIVLSLVMCCMAAAPVFGANDRGVTFSATVSPETLAVSSKPQEVTVSIDANKPVTVDGYNIDIPYPEGWEVVSVSNREISFKEGDYITSIGGESFLRICWQDGLSNSVETTNLAVIVFRVPAGAAAGTYSLKGEAMELTDGGGHVWEDDGSVSFSIVIKTASGEQPGGNDNPGTGSDTPSGEQPGGNESPGGSGTPSGESGDPTDSPGGQTDPGQAGEKEDPSGQSGEEQKDPSGNGGDQEKKTVDRKAVYWCICGGILLILLLILAILNRKKKEEEYR